MESSGAASPTGSHLIALPCDAVGLRFTAGVRRFCNKRGC